MLNMTQYTYTPVIMVETQVISQCLVYGIADILTDALTTSVAYRWAGNRFPYTIAGGTRSQRDINFTANI